MPKYVHIEMIDGIPHRQCLECGVLTIYKKKIGRCPTCQHKYNYFYEKRKRKRVARENGNVPSGRRVDINPKDFEDKHIKGMWTGVTDPKVRRAMRTGDFKEFMKYAKIRE